MMHLSKVSGFYLDRKLLEMLVNLEFQLCLVINKDVLFQQANWMKMKV